MYEEKQEGIQLTISPQSKKSFWKPEIGATSTIRPDTVINPNQDNCIVLDTNQRISETYADGQQKAVQAVNTQRLFYLKYPISETMSHQLSCSL